MKHFQNRITGSQLKLIVYVNNHWGFDEFPTWNLEYPSLTWEQQATKIPITLAHGWNHWHWRGRLSTFGPLRNEHHMDSQTPMSGLCVLAESVCANKIIGHPFKKNEKHIDIVVFLKRKFKFFKWWTLPALSLPAGLQLPCFARWAWVCPDLYLQTWLEDFHNSMISISWRQSC